MPCEYCVHGCEPDCGYEPEWYSVVNEDGHEDDVSCDGFERGEPDVTCGDVPCHICLRVRTNGLNENPFET